MENLTVEELARIRPILDKINTKFCEQFFDNPKRNEDGSVDINIWLDEFDSKDIDYVWELYLHFFINCLNELFEKNNITSRISLVKGSDGILELKTVEVNNE